MIYRDVVRIAGGRLKELNDELTRLYLEHQNSIQTIMKSGLILVILTSSCNPDSFENYDYIPGTIRW